MVFEHNLHSAFYAFAPVEAPEALAQSLRAEAGPLLGSIIVAYEGINGTIAGPGHALQRFETLLRTHFPNMPFKHSTYETPPFGRMKVSVKPRIVAIAGIEGSTPTQSHAISPQRWREMIARDDVVVLDNRNHFEFRLGRFQGAIDPSVSHFKNFPDYVRAHVDQWKKEGKTVAMYCTGGIRCERTSTWVAAQGVPCVELEGGILNYFARMKDAQKDWQGECYVFDNRVALDTDLNETATTAQTVFENLPDEAWRLKRAQRLDEASAAPDDETP